MPRAPCFLMKKTFLFLDLLCAQPHPHFWGDKQKGITGIFEKTKQTFKWSFMTHYGISWFYHSSEWSPVSRVYELKKHVRWEIFSCWRIVAKREHSLLLFWNLSLRGFYHQSKFFLFCWSVIALQCSCRFLLYNKRVSQLYYAYILSHPSHPIPLGHHWALSWAPCSISSLSSFFPTTSSQVCAAADNHQ